jgi:hypothetical protein
MNELCEIKFNFSDVKGSSVGFIIKKMVTNFTKHTINCIRFVAYYINIHKIVIENLGTVHEKSRKFLTTIHEIINISVPDDNALLLIDKELNKSALTLTDYVPPPITIDKCSASGNYLAKFKICTFPYWDVSGGVYNFLIRYGMLAPYDLNDYIDMQKIIAKYKINAYTGYNRTQKTIMLHIINFYNIIDHFSKNGTPSTTGSPKSTGGPKSDAAKFYNSKGIIPNLSADVSDVDSVLFNLNLIKAHYTANSEILYYEDEDNQITTSLGIVNVIDELNQYINETIDEENNKLDEYFLYSRSITQGAISGGLGKFLSTDVKTANFKFTKPYKGLFSIKQLFLNGWFKKKCFRY